MNHQSLWFEQGEWTANPFLEIGKELSFSRENVVFQQDERHPFVYLVLEGRIRIYLLSPNGAERHLYIVGPGNMIGESNVWAEEVHGYNASTSSSARVLQIPKPAFHDIVMRDPVLIQKVLRSLSNKQSALLLQTKLMSFSDIGERVLTMLRQLATSYGKKTAKGITITIPFTHQELAYVVGSSRVSVSYVMNELCENGIIEKQNGRYTLLA